MFDGAGGDSGVGTTSCRKIPALFVAMCVVAAGCSGEHPRSQCDGGTCASPSDGGGGRAAGGSAGNSTGGLSGATGADAQSGAGGTGASPGHLCDACSDAPGAGVRDADPGAGVRDAAVEASTNPHDARAPVVDGPDASASCRGLAATCGRRRDDSCCRSLPVTGGRFERNFSSANEGPGGTYPGRVSDFRLDKYEVSVGRFRKFVSAWLEGFRPAAGAGKHAHLRSGKGLTSSEGGDEPGWDPAWASEVATTQRRWELMLTCDLKETTWTAAPGDHEALPVNCVSWYEANAFCIWDDAFLPSFTELNYAVSGGSEQRRLPWSIPPGSHTTDRTYAVYWATPDLPCSTAVCYPEAVGSRSPKGDGRYGQSDLAGNVGEWTLDHGSGFVGLCDDCVQLYSGMSHRAWFGSTFLSTTSELGFYRFGGLDPAARHYLTGFRCARVPEEVTDAGTGTPVVTGAGKPPLPEFSSCAGSQDICGPKNDENCCASPLVKGGDFNRTNDATRPAHVSDFRLDRFEVTVGRFRKFVDAWNAGFRPAAGAGKHSHLNAGRGLAASTGGFEAGWDDRWTANIATTREEWDQGLTSCHGGQWSWQPGAIDTFPIACVTLYELYAFCHWDGGFLPSDAEWNYAAAGGSEQRPYPWGTVPADDAHGVFGPNALAYLPVGSKSPLGDGRYGHADLVGNAGEWVLDWWYPDFETPTCRDCVDTTVGAFRIVRGGSLGVPQWGVNNAVRSFAEQAGRGIAGRCARPPS